MKADFALFSWSPVIPRSPRVFPGTAGASQPPDSGARTLPSGSACSWGSRTGRGRGGVAVSAPFLNLKIRGSGSPERPDTETDVPRLAQPPQFPPRKGGRRAGREFAGNVTSGPPAPAAG